MEDIKGVEAVGVVAAKALLGKQIGNLFGVMMVLALISSASSMIIASPRVYHAMAVDGCFFHRAKRIHSPWKTPVRSIFYQGMASISTILVSSIKSLFYFVGFALIFSGLAAVGVLKLRKRKGWKGTRALS